MAYIPKEERPENFSPVRSMEILAGKAQTLADLCQAKGEEKPQCVVCEIAFAVPNERFLQQAFVVQVHFHLNERGEYRPNDRGGALAAIKEAHIAATAVWN